jgi:hypothetical protein
MATKTSSEPKAKLSGGDLIPFKSEHFNVSLPASSLLGNIKMVKATQTLNVIRDYTSPIRVHNSTTLVPLSVTMLTEIGASVLATAGAIDVDNYEGDELPENTPNLSADNDQEGIFYYKESLMGSAVQLVNNMDITNEPNFVKLAGKSSKNTEALHSKLYRFSKLVSDMHSLTSQVSLDDDSMTSAPNLIQADSERDNILQRQAERAKAEFKLTMDEVYDWFDEKLYAKKSSTNTVSATKVNLENLLIGNDQGVIDLTVKDLMKAY